LTAAGNLDIRVISFTWHVFNEAKLGASTGENSSGPDSSKDRHQLWDPGTFHEERVELDRLAQAEQLAIRCASLKADS
jgi:hypothetical protein